MVVSVTISCSHRKYRGAFAGFGVTRGFAGSSSGEAMKTAMMLTAAIVASTAIAVRRTRSGTALTVDAGALSVDARITGDCPRATPSSVYVLLATGADGRGVSRMVSRSARARPPSFRTRHM